MQRTETDIFIAGGGIAGMVATVSFAVRGFDVVCVDPAPAGTDSRTTAFMQPSQELLDDIGLWTPMAAEAAPLQIMRIMDSGGEAGVARLIKDFNAAEISDAPFGWNLPNTLIRDTLEARIGTMPNVTLLRGPKVNRILTREHQALVSLTDGSRYSAKLLLGADGRNSFVRETAGISVKTTRYGQKALTFTVTHPVPHQNISTEIHRSGGPFTLVPLPDRDGQHASAVVWMEHGDEALRLSTLPKTEFEAAINERSCAILGDLTLASAIGIWPMISQIATRLTAERTALIAEAAHVVPPIGAQGLNMSLGDLRMLVRLCDTHPLGSEAMLDAYNRQRLPELRLRVRGIDVLNRASMMGAQGLRDLRASALETLYRIKPVRQALMKTGIGH